MRSRKTVSAMLIERYSVYWADLNPVIGSEIAKIRPVVVISDNAMNEHLATVVVCPLTSKPHPEWRSRIPVDCAGRPSEIAVDQIRTISKRRVKGRIDAISAEDAARLRSLVVEMYGTE